MSSFNRFPQEIIDALVRTQKNPTGKWQDFNYTMYTFGNRSKWPFFIHRQNLLRNLTRLSE